MSGGEDARLRAAVLIGEARRSAAQHADAHLEGLLSEAETALLGAGGHRPALRRASGLVRRAAGVVRDLRRQAGVITAGAPRRPWEQAPLGVLMLGPFRVFQGGVPVDTWRGARAQRLLRYLVAHRNRPVPREQLIEVFWPDADPEAGRRNLHQTVYTLRLALRARQPDVCHIVFEGDCYGLAPELGVWVDAEAFEDAVRRGRSAEIAGHVDRAVVAYRCADGLYGGDLLEDTPFEEWVIPERECLRARHTEVLHRLIDLHLAAADLDDAVVCARRLLVRDPTDEVAHRGLMRAHIAQGQRGEAVAQYRRCAVALDREFGLRPGPETTALFEELADVT